MRGFVILAVAIGLFGFGFPQVSNACSKPKCTHDVKVDVDNDLTNKTDFTNKLDIDNNFSNKNQLSQKQDQDQSQTSKNTLNQADGDEVVEVNVSGDQIDYEAPDLRDMPGIPGDIYLGACGASGASASMPGMGVSLGAVHPACLMFDAAIIAFEHRVMTVDEDGMPKSLGEVYLEEGMKLMRRDRFYSKWVSWIPLVGKLL